MKEVGEVERTEVPPSASFTMFMLCCLQDAAPACRLARCGQFGGDNTPTVCTSAGLQDYSVRCCTMSVSIEKRTVHRVVHCMQSYSTYRGHL